MIRLAITVFGREIVQLTITRDEQPSAPSEPEPGTFAGSVANCAGAELSTDVIFGFSQTKD